MSANRWNQKGIAHRRWQHRGVATLESAEHVCEMCGQEEIRYVHHIWHAEHGLRLVGCVCAEKLCEPGVQPRELEQLERNRQGRIRTWLKKPWVSGVTPLTGLPVTGKSTRSIDVIAKKQASGLWKVQTREQVSKDKAVKNSGYAISEQHAQQRAKDLLIKGERT